MLLVRRRTATRLPRSSTARLRSSSSTTPIHTRHGWSSERLEPASGLGRGWGGSGSTCAPKSPQIGSCAVLALHLLASQAPPQNGYEAPPQNGYAAPPQQYGAPPQQQQQQQQPNPYQQPPQQQYGQPNPYQQHNQAPQQFQQPPPQQQQQQQQQMQQMQQYAPPQPQHQAQYNGGGAVSRDAGGTLFP